MMANGESVLPVPGTDYHILWRKATDQTLQHKQFFKVTTDWHRQWWIQARTGQAT